jgi:transcriptional regulator with XRE-family HTH domain
MFYDTIKELCKRRGVSLSQMAKDIHISTGTVQAWKMGSVPQGATLKKLTDYFEVSTDYLLTGSDAPKVVVTYDPDVEIFECIEMLKDERIRKLLLKLKRASAEDLSKVIGMIDVLGIGGEVDG